MRGDTLTAHGVARDLVGDAALCERALYLGVGDWTLQVRSNAVALLERLDRYFAHVRVAPCTAGMTVDVIDGEPPALDVAFADWRREPGKVGRKDSYVDLVDGRLVRKVRTGIVFLQSESHLVAAGPCRQHDNQVINFINAQYMNLLQQDGWLICHAAGVVRNGSALAIAGLSNRGKSTLMLQILEDPDVNYLTNDRLFVRRAHRGVAAAGIPKLPRVNPGTIVHSPRLKSLIPAARRAELSALPAQALWDLEEKHDVPVGECYGAGRIAREGRLAAFVVLAWQRDDDHPPCITSVDLDTRGGFLDAIMKSPGPFYQDAEGRFRPDTVALDPVAYREALAGIPVFALTGSIDFDAAAQQIGAMQWWRHA